jgi:hypothetical protein
MDPLSPHSRPSLPHVLCWTLLEHSTPGREACRLGAPAVAPQVDKTDCSREKMETLLAAFLFFSFSFFMGLKGVRHKNYRQKTI